jgi:hypothetical protein
MRLDAMTQAARKPEPDASLAMPAIGHALRGRMGGIAAARTNMRQHRAALVSAGWRASAFVVSLRQRYLRLRMGDPRPEQVLAAAGPPAAVSAPQQHWHLAYAPRVTLQLAASDRAVPAAAQPQVRAPVYEYAATQDGPRFVSTLIERVLNHSERTDALKIVERAAPVIVRHESGETAAVGPHSTIAPVAGSRVQRVLRVDKAAAIAKTMPSAGSSPAQAAVRSRQEAPASEPAAPARNAPQINIERLADRVVHAIDRRMLAQRERYGRA